MMGATSPKGSSQQASLSVLVRRMAEGDQAAASEFYDQSCQLLYALAFRIVTNVEDAEEVLHDVYCRAWRNAHAYDDGRSSVMSWLVLMTRSIAIDLVRSKRKMTAVVAVEDAAEQIESNEPSPEALAGASQEALKVRRALSCLPAEQRVAVELAFFSGLTHSELSEHLNVPLGTVKTRVRVGLSRLRHLLEEPGA